MHPLRAAGVRILAVRLTEGDVVAVESGSPLTASPVRA
jgi:hypothetical protein